MGETKLNLPNEERGLCVMCGAPTDRGTPICRECGRPCAVATPLLQDSDLADAADMRSVCCGAGVGLMADVTCSRRCHELFVMEMEKMFGPEKLITSAVTGKTYRVPVRDIIETGITHRDLVKYPVVEDGK